MITYREVLYQYVTTSIAVLSIIANGVEIYLIKKSKRNKLLALAFIFNLSLSDCFAGFLMVILKIMHPYMKTTLKGNESANEAYLYIKFACIRFALFISIFTLIALTVDRVLAVKKPFYVRHRHSTIPVATCISIWVISIICITIIYSVLRSCNAEVNRYVNLVITVAVFSATVIFVVCYGIIFHSLRKQQRRVDDMAVIYPNASDMTSPASEIKCKDIRNHAIEIKVLKIAVKNICIFMGCWGPLAFLCLFRAMGTIYISQAVYSTFFTLAFSSTLINPLLYLFNSRKKILKQQ